MPKLVFLPTDAVIWVLIAAVCAGFCLARGKESVARRWKQVLSGSAAQASAVVLGFCLVIAALDSVHFRPLLEQSRPGRPAVYAPAAVSLLDHCLLPRIARRERSYSAPFAWAEHDKTSGNGELAGERTHARLRGITPAAADEQSRNKDLALRAASGAGTAALLLCLLAAPFALLLRRPGFRRERLLARRGIICAAAMILASCVLLAFLWGGYHPFGTDKTGNDVLFQSLKSLRTAFVLGTLATLSMLPFALVLGISAGYFRGWVDDIVQYLYTTISSIPSVLLIAACVLMVQVFIDQHPALLPTELERGDAKLLFIAMIIGVTSWAGLARLLRAETMKLSAQDFITASRAAGCPAWKIMLRHILPNVLHIVLIVSVIGFSDIILYEAVLAYVGVGVDPSMNSYGSMINAARSEMSRTPAVWWNLLAAFACMVSVVLSANLFAAAVRDAFDPRASRAPGRKEG